MAAFDDYGAHFNPAEGYHMHGAVGCSEVGDATADETPMFGYAMDGYPVHSPLDTATAETAGLDECNGHTTAEASYRYHANNAAENKVTECQTVAGNHAGGRHGARPDGPHPVRTKAEQRPTHSIGRCDR